MYIKDQVQQKIVVSALKILHEAYKIFPEYKKILFVLQCSEMKYVLNKYLTKTVPFSSVCS